MGLIEHLQMQSDTEKRISMRQKQFQQISDSLGDRHRRERSMVRNLLTKKGKTQAISKEMRDYLMKTQNSILQVECCDWCATCFLALGILGFGSGAKVLPGSVRHFLSVFRFIITKKLFLSVSYFQSNVYTTSLLLALF